MSKLTNLHLTDELQNVYFKYLHRSRKAMAIKWASQSSECSLQIGVFCRVIIKMLTAALLLSLFIGVVVCEDDETMALVITGFQIITLSND